jgi:ABC-type uncharacterized transport system substrate-binding protein
MQGNCFLSKRRMAGVLAALGLALSGCTTFLDDAPRVMDEVLVVNDSPSPLVVPVPIPPSKSVTKVPTPPRVPPIAVVLTNSQPAYQDVALELAQYFADHAVYDLSSESLPPVAVLNSINDTDATVVVAIGLQAAQSSVAMSNVPVVFSQVFNHQEHELIRENSRGIAAFAPLDAQLAAWKKADPNLSRIGMIIGEGHDELVIDAEVAAARHGLDLQIRYAQSDQETLYVFRRMIRDVDGFWLFPDNRILSSRVLAEMLQEANDQDVPVVGPSESMLELGAAISMSTVAADIAAAIAGVVKKIQAGEIEQLPPMTALSEVRVAINDKRLAPQTVANSNVGK